MTEATQHDIPRHVKPWALWLPLVIPPAVWAIQMEINYALVPSRCTGGTRLPIYSMVLISLLLAAISAALGYSNWQKLPANLPEDSPTPDRFLTVLGLLVSGM